MIRIRRLSIMLLIGICSGFIVMFVYVPTTSQDAYLQSIRNEDMSLELRKNISKIADEQGVAYAVEFTTEALAERMIGMDDCRTILHTVGHAAYRQYGSDFDAIFSANKERICLEGYPRGVEAEITARGDTAELVRFCRAEREFYGERESCYHGAGHSIFETTGSVAESLKFCGSLTAVGSTDIPTCYRGVFSEISNRMIGVDTHTGFPSVPLTSKKQDILPEDPYALCRRLPQKYGNACYSQLSKLFYRADAPVESIANCISAAPDVDARSMCVSTIAGTVTRRILDSGSPADIPAFIRSTSPDMRADVFAGARDGYGADKSRKPSWQNFCARFFADDETVCGAAQYIVR